MSNEKPCEEKIYDGDLKDSISLKDFLKCFELDTYVKIYNGSNAINDLVYEGNIEKFINDEKTYNQHSGYKMVPEFAEIQQPGDLQIIIDE